ncbi:MAG: hypothetical protein O3A01_08300 [bacterium]|nr:hypothetical protein [bacterium]
MHLFKKHALSANGQLKKSYFWAIESAYVNNLPEIIRELFETGTNEKLLSPNKRINTTPGRFVRTFDLITKMTEEYGTAFLVKFPQVVNNLNRRQLNAIRNTLNQRWSTHRWTLKIDENFLQNQPNLRRYLFSR